MKTINRKSLTLGILVSTSLIGTAWTERIVIASNKKEVKATTEKSTDKKDDLDLDVKMFKDVESIPPKNPNAGIDEPVVKKPRESFGSKLKRFFTQKSSKEVEAEKAAEAAEQDAIIEKLTTKKEVKEEEAIESIDLAPKTPVQKEIADEVKEAKMDTPPLVAPKQDVKPWYEEKVELTPNWLAQEVAKQNATLTGSQKEWEITKTQLELEKAVFIPEFYSNFKKQSLKEPNTIEEVLSRQTTEYDEDVDAYEIGFRGKVSTGGEWNLSLSTDKRDSNLITGLEENEGSLMLTFRQPLLKGRGKDASKAKINVAKINNQIDYHEYKKEMMETCGRAVQSYWLLYGTNEIVRTWKESLALAENTLASLEKLQKSGKATMDQVLEARSGLSLRRAELLNAQGDLQSAQSRILTLLNTSVADVPSDLDLTPRVGPKPSNVKVPSVKESLAKAKKNWPASMISELNIKKEKIQERYWKNQALPKLDFISGYGQTSLENDFGDAFGRSFDHEYKNWYVGVEFSIPLHKKVAKGNLKVARLKRQIAVEAAQAMERSLANELHSMITQLKNAQQLYSDRMSDTELRRQILSNERKKLEKGKSNLREVFQVEEEYIENVRRYLHSLIRWKQAEIALAITEGDLLEQYGIGVETK